MKTTKRIVSVLLALIMGLACFYVISFAEETEHLTEVPEGYVGVYTKDDLDNIKLDMSGKYILMNDIVFEDSDFEKGGSFYNSGKGWEPIGTTSTQFKGVFDGNRYIIKNLYVKNSTQSYVGLFGCASNAIFKNIKIENGNITGGSSTGGIVGYLSKGKVDNCNYSGTVSGGSYYTGGIVGFSCDTSSVSYSNTHGTITGETYVGGIVGYQKGYKASNSNSYNYINHCNNSADILAYSHVGGIVGYSISSTYRVYYCGDYWGCFEWSYVQYCSNSGSVTAQNSNAGGIVGSSCGSDASGFNAYNYVNYCYNIGDVVANSGAGGLIGSCSTYTIAKYCYSVGAVVAKSSFGGCFGSKPNSESFCYYLDVAVVKPTCILGTPKSVDQMIKQSTFEQWDFENVWTMDGREDYPYPELKEVSLILPEDSMHKHEYTSEITTPATHTATGVMTYTCSCGDTYTETIGKIAEHSHDAVVTPPTCTEQGYTTYTCKCGDSYVDDYVPEKGHDEGIWSVTKPSTPTESGVMHLFCGECGFVLETKVIPATGKVHSVAISDVSLDYKASTTITPSIVVDSGVKYTVTYSSSNPSVASVDENGKVTSNGTGSAAITVTVTDEFGNTVSDTCEVKVNYNWWQWIIVIVLFGWIWY